MSGNRRKNKKPTKRAHEAPEVFSQKRAGNHENAGNGVTGLQVFPDSHNPVTVGVIISPFSAAFERLYLS